MRFPNIGLCALVSAVGAFSAVATAPASTILTFLFTDLDGDYNSATAEFTAVAADLGGLQTGGDVSRVISPIGTADFDSGFSSGSSMADFVLSMTLTGITATTATVAPGDGSLAITDADGDTFNGSVAGDWTIDDIGSLIFVGDLTNVTLNDDAPTDGTFDGPSSGSFSMDFTPLTPPFVGATLTLVVPTGGFFDSGGFHDVGTLITGQVLPEPTTLLLLAVGAVAFVTRPRRSVAPVCPEQI